MRLLNCQKFLNGEPDALEEFFNRKLTARRNDKVDDLVPAYYILSHCWGEDETSYTDFVEGRKKGGAGHKKITDYCTFALSRHAERPKPAPVCYVWIDTCCIDKRSSAELSEAINSMWNYYHRAVECHVYLGDVTYSEILSSELSSGEILSESETTELGNEQVKDELTSADEGVVVLAQARWFTRGWTLQELLAPFYVLFLCNDWTILGHKCRFCLFRNGGCRPVSEGGCINISMLAILESITGIDRSSLADPSEIHKASVAKRMNWASQRSTTRLEDEAYSLLGLFDVNMPLLYGEGTKAFQRLQEAILLASTDHSLFVWESMNHWRTGLLASSPANFELSGDVEVQNAENGAWPYEMTNLGVKIRLEARRLHPEKFSRKQSRLWERVFLGDPVPKQAYIVALNAYRDVCAEDEIEPKGGTPWHTRPKATANLILCTDHSTRPQLYKVLSHRALESYGLKHEELEKSKNWELKKFYIKARSIGLLD